MMGGSDALLELMCTEPRDSRCCGEADKVTYEYKLLLERFIIPSFRCMYMRGCLGNEFLGGGAVDDRREWDINDSAECLVQNARRVVGLFA